VLRDPEPVQGQEKNAPEAEKASSLRGGLVAERSVGERGEKQGDHVDSVWTGGPTGGRGPRNGNAEAALFMASRGPGGRERKRNFGLT